MQPEREKRKHTIMMTNNSNIFYINMKRMKTKKKNNRKILLVLVEKNAKYYQKNKRETDNRHLMEVEGDFTSAKRTKRKKTNLRKIKAK